MTRPASARESSTERGFTLVELLVVMAITTALLALGVGALRNFWQVRSLKGGAQEIEMTFRAQHEQAVSRSLPNVFGVWFAPGSSTWGLVRYDTSTGSCTPTGTRSFDAGVKVSTVDFTAITTPPMTPTCLDTLGVPNAEVAFFFARGSATAGAVTLTHPSLTTASDRTVTVLANTSHTSET
jgi:prepilin-type N-terminal cleavage/methylation domain-containing protein